MNLEKIIAELKELKDPQYVKRLDYFGVNAIEALGLRTPQIKSIAKKYKKDHELALELWKNPIHEAKLLSVFIDDPKKVVEQQMDQMVQDFYSWDLVDQACINLFAKHNLAFQKVFEWTARESEFQKRTGFSLIAVLAVHSKQTSDNDFIPFFKLIEDHATDDRNFVKKSVNWALRGLGKRSQALHPMAIECAHRILKINDKTANWIASDALRELNDPKILKRLKI